jgi:hypothetical protein
MGLGPNRNRRESPAAEDRVCTYPAGNFETCRPLLSLRGCTGSSLFLARFGFLAAETMGIRCAWAVLEEVFRVRILDQEHMQGVQGVHGIARYQQEFEEALTS